MESTRGRWLGIGLRLLATLFFLWLLTAVNRCGPTTEPTDATPAGSLPGPLDMARLQVKVDPQGAAVQVDGQFVGTTPLTLEIPPGQHAVRVELSGFEPLEQELTLGAAVARTDGCPHCL